MERQKPGNSTGPGSEVVKRPRECRRKASGRSWTDVYWDECPQALQEGLSDASKIYRYARIAWYGTIRLRGSLGLLSNYRIYSNHMEWAVVNSANRQNR